MKIVGLGVDLAEIERVFRVLEKYPRFAERCFTQHERDYAFGLPDPSVVSRRDLQEKKP